MKCEIIKEEAPEVFEPVSFKITCESEIELRSLWCRMNISVGSINGCYTGGIGPICGLSDVLNKVNYAMSKAGIKP